VPSIPDIPGKSLIGGTTKRARVVVAAVAGGALAVGGVVAKRVLGHGAKDEGATDSEDRARAEADDKVVPIAKEKAPPKPKPAKPKAAKAKPKAAPKPKSDKAKPPKPKAAPRPKPAAEKPKPDAEPGNRSDDKGPHQALNNPIGDPDQTEYPDPYETRPDPRDPVDPDGAPFGEEPHPATGAESTSEPPLENDPEHPEGGRPPRRENLDQ
jgi:hypothetical protein